MTDNGKNWKTVENLSSNKKLFWKCYFEKITLVDNDDNQIHRNTDTFDVHKDTWNTYFKKEVGSLETN